MHTHILRTLVGSRAHGIETPESDHDYKGVYFVSASQFFDPFTEPERTVGKDDDVSYEFQHFIKLCLSGNPTALEVLFSAAEGNDVQADQGIWRPDLGEALTGIRRELLDSTRIYHAHRGFAASQIKRLQVNGVEPRRYRKALSTYIRVMGMGVDFFERDVYRVRVPEPRRSRLLEIRSMSDADALRHNPTKVIERFESRLDEAYERRKHDHTVTEATKSKIRRLAADGYR